MKNTLHNQGISIARRCLCGFLAAIMLSLIGCGHAGPELLRAPTEVAEATVSIETTYGTLAFPEEAFGNMRHQEVTEGAIAMEVFYMVTEDGEKELYRIHYADEQIGTLVGYLLTDSGEISVSYSICQYEDGDFANEEERSLYHSMMDAFSFVLNSILTDRRFSETRTQVPVADQLVTLRHWNVTLPKNVQFSETEENGDYVVAFYGEVSGERVDLYRITLGETEEGTVLGWYTVDGIQKPIMVQTHDLTVYERWPEESQSVIYRMMDSLNTVVQTIVADENFSETKPSV